MVRTGMYSVHTGTYQCMTLKYVPGTYFFARVCTQKHTFFYQFEPGTYRYILKEKSMYSVHTSGKKYVPGTNLFMSVYSGTIL